MSDVAVAGSTKSTPEDPAEYMEWALEKAGGGGFFQKKYLVLLGVPWIYWGMQTYTPLFFKATPSFTVVCPGDAAPLPCGEVHDANEEACKLDETSYSFTQFLCGDLDDATKEACSLPSGASYDYPEEATSRGILASFDLLCDYKKPLAQQQLPFLDMVFFVGFATGLPLGGMWADSRGRKEAYLFGLVVLAVPGVLQATAHDYFHFAVARCLFGFGFAIMVMTAFVWSSEFLGAESRGTIVWSANCMFALGQILISPVAYCFQQWHDLAWAVFVIGCLLFTYVWSLHESPKWLASKQRYAAAYKVLCRVAKGNGKPTPPPPPGDAKQATLEREFTEDIPGQKGSVLQLCDRRLLTRFLVSCLSWFTVSFGFYGLSLNAGSLPLDIYTANAINGLVQIPAYVAAAFLMEAPWCGRKKACMLGYVVAGACMLLSLAIPIPAVRVVLSYAGNFFISISFGTVFLYAAELFPTNIRGAGLSITSVFARIGAMLSPFVAALGTTSPSLPLLLFGVPCLVTGALQVFLPETRGTTLPDTIDDIKPPGKEDASSDSDSEDNDDENGEEIMVQAHSSLVSNRA